MSLIKLKSNFLGRNEDQEVMSLKIRDYMRSVLQTYESLRGRSIEDLKCSKQSDAESAVSDFDTANLKFWDLVVITTADVDQSVAYRRQISSKFDRGELPPNLRFRVYHDTPANVKIGSGGSVLNALKQLHAEYGAELYKWRILLICAGGQSQRLPTASVLGKLFLALPILGEGRSSSLPYHMLDLKLAMYLPFLQRAAPGIFVTCSDDVETYCLPSEGDENGGSLSWTFTRPGFTALGHLSPVAIGKTHGVYVLDASNVDDDGGDDQSEVWMQPCKRVLQKPSVEMMRMSNAFLGDDEKTLCTDSVFFFDAAVTKALVDSSFLDTVTCELDAYGDFLRPLGPDADLSSYVEDTGTVVSATSTSTLSSTRRHLYELLRSFPLHVVVPKHSRFYHIGTMTEFVDNLTASEENRFFAELNCTGFLFSLCQDCIGSSLVDERRFPQATIMHSVIGPRVHIGRRTIVEFCEIKGPVNVGRACILDNCSIDNGGSPTTMDVPSDCCFHTITMSNGKYVTVAFGLTDDLKRKCEDAKSQVSYMGLSLDRVCSSWGSKMMEGGIFVDVDPSGLRATRSLWNANLFPLADSMEESFEMTLKLVVCARQHRPPPSTDASSQDGDANNENVSMCKALQCKDVDRMMDFRERLNKMIGRPLQ